MCGCSLLLQSNGADPAARAAPAPAASLFLCRTDAAPRPSRFSLPARQVFSFPPLQKSSSPLSCRLHTLPLPPFQRPHRLACPCASSPFPVQLPSLPIKLSLSPFPSYITPPPLSPLTSLRLPPVRLSLPSHPRPHQNAPSTTHTHPIARTKHFRCSQGPRESSPAHTTRLPPTQPPPPGGRQNRRIATRHTTPDRPRALLLDPFWLYIRLEGE
jgi:hypothetical protein